MNTIDRDNIGATWRQALEQGLIDPVVDTSVIFLNLSVVADRFRRIVAAFPASTLHAVAVKANPLTAVLRFLNQLGAGLEAASWPEVQMAVAAGFERAKIVYNSPARTQAEIDRACAQFPGLRVNADSLDELQRYPGGRCGLRLGLRINPLVAGDTVEYLNVAGAGSKFGEPISNRQSIVEQCRNLDDVDCLHVHVGSQIANFDPSIRSIRSVVDLANEINQGLREPGIQFLNIGGGFPASYHHDRPAADIQEYADLLRQACPELYDGSYQLITEFGRYVHANACWSVSDIEYAKSSGSDVILINHLGADMFLREAYKPGDWPHEMFVMDAGGEPKNVGPEINTHIAGPLCFGGDFVQTDCLLAPAVPGDKLVIRDVGANTFSLWSRHCSRPFPKVISYVGSAEQLKIAKPRESIDSIIGFWS